MYLCVLVCAYRSMRHHQLMDESSSSAPVASSFFRRTSNFPFFSLSLIQPFSLHFASSLSFFLGGGTFSVKLNWPLPLCNQSVERVEIMCLLVSQSKHCLKHTFAEPHVHKSIESW